MRPYLNLVNEVLSNGTRRTNRTGVDTISLFGTQTRYDLRKGFPLVTTRYTPINSVVKELLWFLRGETNIKTLGCKIWDAWADERGELGPIYGSQWRHWNPQYDGGGYDAGVDQIAQALDLIQTQPDSRRIIVSSWNPTDIPVMALPPCHVMFQFNVDGDFLDMQLYQRSADLMIGVPFNVASYAMLLSMFAHQTGKIARHFIHTIGDAHIYENHVKNALIQLDREPLALPRLEIKSCDVLKAELDYVLHGYHNNGPMKYEIAV